MYTDKSIHEILLPRRVTLYSLKNNVFNFKVNNNLIKMYPIIHSFINCKVLAKKKKLQLRIIYYPVRSMKFDVTYPT